MRKREQTHSSEGNVTVLKLSRVTVKYSTLVMTEKKAAACSPKNNLRQKPGTLESVAGTVTHQNK